MTKVNVKPHSRKFKDIKGQIFGRWTVESYAGEQYWNCTCQCGTKSKVYGKSLRQGSSKSCGCINKDNPPAQIHGESKTPEYKCWIHMKERCLNPSDSRYPHYGERGIQVCERWQISFQLFLKDMGKRPSPMHSLDRIDNNGNYEPGNCRWATDTQQARNKSTTHTLTHNGETKTISEWAEEYGIKYHTLYHRVVIRGQSSDFALRPI